MEDRIENFIMLPTNDFCFKGLMRNEKVRRGFIAAILKRKPEDIKETTLLPSENSKNSLYPIVFLIIFESGYNYLFFCHSSYRPSLIISSTRRFILSYKTSLSQKGIYHLAL